MDDPNQYNNGQIEANDSQFVVLLKRIGKALGQSDAPTNSTSSNGTAIGGAGTVVTPTITLVTTGGMVSAGSRSLTFIFSANFAGSVLGTAYAGPADASQPLVPPPGCTLAAVTYTVTAGSIRIVDIR